MQTALAVSIESQGVAGDAEAVKIEAICRRVESLRATAALSVNQALIQLYWEIGRALVGGSVSVAAGEAGAFGHLAAELQRRFPAAINFGRANLWRASEFYLAWYEQVEDDFHAPEARSMRPLPAFLYALSWEDHGVLLECVPDPSRRRALAEQAVACRWSHAELHARVRRGNATEGAQAGWAPQAGSVAASSPITLAADAHHLDLLALMPELRARQRLTGQVERIRDYLMQQEHGFAWVGDRIPLSVGRDDLTVSLLCYHLQMRRYVAFNLYPSPISQPVLDRMAFALAVLDDRFRHADDKASIGVAVGWSGTRTEFVQVLRGMPLPGVAPTIERLGRALMQEKDRTLVVSTRSPARTAAY